MRHINNDTNHLGIPAKVLLASATSAANACISTPNFCAMAAVAREASPPTFTFEAERMPRVLSTRNDDSLEYLADSDATNPQDASEGMAT